FIQVMFVLQNPPGEGTKLGDLQLTPVDVPLDVAKFDLTLFIEERGKTGVATLEYNTDLFDAATISRMLGHFEQLLKGIVANPARRLSDLPLLTDAERKQLLVEWNQTQTDYPRDRSVHELFEEQARMRPESPVVIFGESCLTYSELDKRANQLAHRLARSGVCAGAVVGICLERSVEMIVALLGILKAGAAYASLDPASPKDRIAMMLEDLKTPVVLIQEKFQSLFPNTASGQTEPNLICLDSDWQSIARENDESPKCNISATDLAYVSFTSGSTGRPKGVCVPHRAVVRLAKNTNFATFSPDEVFLQMAPISFDASTLEIWCCFLNGGRLVVMPPEIPSLSDLSRVIQKHQVTTAWFTSGLFNQLVDEEPEALKSLRQILAGGDVLSSSHVKKVMEWPGARRLINGYGPTENTTFTTCYTVPVDFTGDRSVPIGRPIANTQCYILDAHLQPVPIGVTGELYTGGDGLATGYINQPGLTAEKFIPNPFKPGECLYKTGDLARYLPDGNIEYLGRADGQVKLRGFRIEPGEIETILNAHPEVRESVVIATGESANEKRLAAYFVSRKQSPPTAAELREFLRTKLPEYMLPSRFIPMEQLPLTQNGKVDRRALLAQPETRSAPEKKLSPPKDALEAELKEIWESVLGINPIGVEEKFFELGGHSLLAVRLVARLEKKFGRKLPLSMVFQAQTIAQMAQYLRSEPGSGSVSSVVAIQSGGTKPPLFFVHGVGGGMFWGYTNLARSLGPEQPVYVLKSRAMDGQEEFSSIEQMAAQYVSDIRSMQPKGPYQLGGFCFGGIVAYEMARQFEAAGEQVAMLTVLNSAPPNSNYWHFQWTPASMFRFARNLGLLIMRSLRWDPQQRKEFLRWKAAQTRRKFSRMLKMPNGGSYQFSAEEVVDLSSFTRDQRKLWEAHIISLIQFFPKRYKGKVTLFRSRGHPLLCSYDGQCGWDELASQVEMHVVPGEHESILEEPHVRVLAAKLKECLRRLQSPETVPASVAGLKTKAADSQTGASANQPSADYPRELCVHQLFEEQVKRTPDAPALLAGGERLTYAEINRRANQLAHHLEALGVGPDVPVGISLERSPELVIGLLAILKAGGAYVPLDPAYPRERLSKMLENSRAPILLTQHQFVSTLPAENLQVILLDEPLPAGLKESNPVPRASANNLAYVIYTSGSTGQPKGVAMEHRPLVNLLWWQLKNSAMGKGDRTLQFASVSFDVSFQEIFSTWCSGGELVLISEEVRHDPQQLARLLAEEKVKRLFLPFIALNHLSESIGAEESRSFSLREVITAGEQLRITNKITAFFEALPECTLHNHYGPSESHVVTAYTMSGPSAKWAALPPIGQPIANTQIHLLDANLKPVLRDEPGELYIGGDCLARGYLHRPDLTAERFVNDPFSAEPGARMYKTGDLARRLPDGNVEFLGRVDHQVKIRGFRVELSEIEAVLGKHPGVRECAVAAREDVPSQRRLVAYIVRQPAHVLTIDELRAAVLDKLPDYMAPSAFVFLEALPLTPSGKVNRLALPAPDQNRPQLGGEFVAAANETEARLAGIWSEVLNVKEVGTQDNFFDLGGNSLSAAQVISRVREAFKVELPVSCLFEAPTIASLAEGISTRRWSEGRPAVPPLKRAPRSGNPPLSFTQGRLWFIDRLEPGSHAYNVPMAIRLQGGLDLKVLQNSLDKIVSRHESLRTSVSFANGNLAQVISPDAHLKISVVNCETFPPSERAAQAKKAVEKQARQPFNLERGPLVRCTLVRLSEQEHILLVVMHHIISDGWSLAVFFKELNLLYDAYASGRLAPILPVLPVQYADYTLWQQQWMQGTVLDQHVSHWTEKLKGAPLSLQLPMDPPSQTAPAGNSGQETLLLPKASSEALQGLCRREGLTPFMVLLAGLAITLQRWTEQSDMVIGTVVAGRNHRELENLIGCFMNFVPLRITATETATGAEFLARVKSAVIDANAHQECPFEKIVEAVNPERKTSQNPLYNVAFLMQNYPTATVGGRLLESEPVPVDLQAALLDLRFIAEESAAGISVACEYKADLFTAGTIEQLMASFTGVLAALVEEPGKQINQFQLVPQLAAQCKAAREREDRQTIAVAATFTAEPVEDSLKYWMKELDMVGRVEFAPYNQVFQQLLDPSSLLGTNQRGLNVIFIRFEDWEKTEGGPETPAVGDPSALERSIGEFITSLKSLIGRGAAPCLICLCPSSKSALLDSDRAALHRRMEELLSISLEPIAGAYVVSTKEINQLYPVAECHDARAEAFGAIPYTATFFTALGTVVARKFHALKRPAYKVIVLDCDQTLWSGVCGEDGPTGIELNPSRRVLQEFMRAQSASGMLLCICSKNNQADVAAVFESRREMPLKREHFAAWRVNWQPKSENLKSLASELRVGLDSFIFVDDNPVECAEVAANCPEVLTLQLPEPPEEIPQFLNHCWAFDHLKLSAEDRQRTASYQQEKEREQLRSQSLNLSDFLAGLDLKVEIARLSSEQLTR
ncbi:MAG TPA: amino acid adenylation domain-containing protein, partial [Verrucomicrobiae bacterium]|nr:amino acid adenylation domain-containing protein [Verrucomicrobiae bacterium]